MLINCKHWQTVFARLWVQQRSMQNEGALRKKPLIESNQAIMYYTVMYFIVCRWFQTKYSRLIVCQVYKLFKSYMRFLLHKTLQLKINNSHRDFNIIEIRSKYYYKIPLKFVVYINCLYYFIKLMHFMYKMLSFHSGNIW